MMGMSAGGGWGAGTGPTRMSIEMNEKSTRPWEELGGRQVSRPRYPGATRCLDVGLSWPLARDRIQLATVCRK